jgi:protein-disulfide isomerase
MNMRLSEAAGISGTPAFIVGDKLADGAFDYAGLKGEIGDARAAARKGR